MGRGGGGDLVPLHASGAQQDASCFSAVDFLSGFPFNLDGDNEMNKREWMLQAALPCVGEAVGNGQESEWVRGLSRMYDAICAATAPETDWVEHDGDVSKAPEEGRNVVVESRHGSVYSSSSSDLSWDHHGGYDDIVRWRYA